MTYAKGKWETINCKDLRKENVTFPTASMRWSVTMLLKGISEFGFWYLKLVFPRTKLSSYLGGFLL